MAALLNSTNSRAWIGLPLAASACRASSLTASAAGDLGEALRALGRREAGTARLEEAVDAFDACLMVTASVWLPEWVSRMRALKEETRAEIRQRTAR